MDIELSTKIRKAAPELTLAIISCNVINSQTSTYLSDEMEMETQQIAEIYSIDEINKRPEIAATRKVYKNLGKDPNRYRPSAEALCRRIVRRISLYQVNTLVDIINLVSIRSGFSINGFDAYKIQGNILLDVGTANDEFEAIGRGLLNVEGLPLYRDSAGGIGTPTSDNERTKISENTTQLLMIINSYNGGKELQSAVDQSIRLLEKYADLKEYNVEWIE